jgi:hypothetical protein
MTKNGKEGEITGKQWDNQDEKRSITRKWQWKTGNNERMTMKNNEKQ